MAEFAFKVNEQTENIGARRLHTIMERVLEDVSFLAPDVARRAADDESAAVLSEAIKNESSTPLPYLERMTASGPEKVFLIDDAYVKLMVASIVRTRIYRAISCDHQALLQIFLKTGQPIINREEKMILPDGKTRWTAHHQGAVARCRRQNRRLDRHWAGHHRPQAGGNHRPRRNLLRTLIDNLPDSIYAKDAEARKILANPANCKRVGCQTEAEVIGKTDYDFFPPDIAAGFLPMTSRC